MKISMFAEREEVRGCAIENGYSPNDGILAQIYALYEIAHWKRAEIANHLNYAPSTVSTKRSKMWECAELAKILFEDTTSADEFVEVVEEVVEKRVLYRKFKNDTKPKVPMEFMPDCGENIQNEQAVYFFKFFDETELLFDKIGTTAKDVVGRLRDEIGDYSKKFNIRRVEIHRICSCGNLPAEGAESALRAEMIRRYPEAFRRNDRFFGVDISPIVFDEVLKNFMK